MLLSPYHRFLANCYVPGSERPPPSEQNSIVHVQVINLCSIHSQYYHQIWNWIYCKATYRKIPKELLMQLPTLHFTITWNFEQPWQKFLIKTLTKFVVMCRHPMKWKRRYEMKETHPLDKLCLSYWSIDQLIVIYNFQLVDLLFINNRMCNVMATCIA